MNLTTTKIITMVLLAVISFFVGIIPLKLSHFIGNRENKKMQTLVTSMLLCFGGGVLLATSMVHILPEVREGLTGYGEGLSISLPELIVCGGFFLVYLVEELVHLVIHRKSNHQLQRSFSIHNKNRESREEGVNGVMEMTCIHNDKMMTSGEEKRASITSYNPKYEVKMRPSTASMFPNYHSPDQDRNSSADDMPCTSRPQSENPNLTTPASTETEHNHIVADSKNTLRDLLTVIALSFHAVFEGMAVGLEENVSDVWTLFAAIGSHKFVITFCVFLELSQNGTRIVFYSLYLIAFAAVSPFGIGVGIIISEVSVEGEYHQLYIAILQGIAAGTIIYIVMFEVLQREKTRDVSGLLQLIAIMTGFTVMILIQIFAGHHHDHDHDPNEHCHIHEACDMTHYLELHHHNISIVPLEDIDHDSTDHLHQNDLDGVTYNTWSHNASTGLDFLANQNGMFPNSSA